MSGVSGKGGHPIVKDWGQYSRWPWSGTLRQSSPPKSRSCIWKVERTQSRIPFGGALQVARRFRLPALFRAATLLAWTPYWLRSWFRDGAHNVVIVSVGCLPGLAAIICGSARGAPPALLARPTRGSTRWAGRRVRRPADPHASGLPVFADFWAGGRGLAAVATVYAVLLAIVSWKHTFWRDEAQAWLIARSSTSLASVVHNVRYEGHPPLWHFLLYLISRFTWNPEWMKVPNYLFSVGAAVLILSAAKVPAWVRIGFVFSYFMLFEYAVVDRNYMIGVMLLAAALTFCKNDASGMKTSAALSLAALTSLPALIVALCLYPVHLVSSTEGSRAPGARGRLAAGFGVKRVAAAMLFAVSVLAALAIIRPPADASTLPSHGHWRQLQHLFRLSNLTEAYLPIPGSFEFWNSSLFFDLGRWTGPAVGLALALLLCLWFRRKEARCFFLAASCLLMAEMAVANVFQMRHVGWLFIVFLLAVILEYEAVPLRAPSVGGGTWPWRSGLLGVVLAVQVATGLFVCGLSLRAPFSESREVAEYLRQRHLDRAPLVFFPDVIGEAVLAYLQRPSAYAVERHALFSYIVWDRIEGRPRHLPSKAEFSAAAENGRAPVLITSGPLPETETSALGVRCVAYFGGGLGGDGQYYVYR